jgi:ribulose-5-phosphate 4-epimerase/fuculose-1-phosphate aldolase
VVDHEGKVLGDSGYSTNPAGFVIHGAVHMAVPQANCIIHTHSRYGTAVAMQKQGLLPASQKALTVMGWLAYHDFEGAALDTNERPRIVGDLGERKILILRNHGLLSTGCSVGEAFVWTYRIETACRQQIDAQSGGAQLMPLSAETQQRTIDQGLKMYGPGGFIEVGLEWPALLRQLERADGDGYRQ